MRVPSLYWSSIWVWKVECRYFFSNNIFLYFSSKYRIISSIAFIKSCLFSKFLSFIFCGKFSRNSFNTYFIDTIIDYESCSPFSRRTLHMYKYVYIKLNIFISVWSLWSYWCFLKYSLNDFRPTSSRSMLLPFSLKLLHRVQ